MTEPTADELKNGWTASSLAAYRRERDEATGHVPGNIVTKWERPRPPIRLEGSLQHNPHKMWR